LFFLIIGCGSSSYFDDLPKPNNTNCAECSLTVPAFTEINPLIINPLIEIYDDNGNRIASKYNFNSWDNSVLNIDSGKKIEINIAFWEVCSSNSGSPIYARLWEGRAFLSPQECNEVLDLNTVQWITHNCEVYPFQ
jgi:hypothetical protein